VTDQARVVKPVSLIDVADSLARGCSGVAPPTPAELRRSISTAYDAAFSALISRAARLLLPDGTNEEHAATTRVLRKR
jgi:hypothetical protein